MKAMIVLLFILTGAAYSQCMDSLWISSPGSTNGDQGAGIELSGDGYVVACGYYDLTGITQGVGWISKVNPATGEPQWTRTFSGGSQSIFIDITRTNDGGFICGGWARNPPDNDQDFWFLRVNANGDSLWSRTYGHEFYNQGIAVVATPDGGYAMAGRVHTIPGGAGNVDWWILKINANGDSMWSQSVGNPDEDRPYDMILTSDNNYLIGGMTTLDSTGAARLALIGQTGNVIWDRLYEFAPSVEIHGMFETPDGFLACGAQHDWNENNDIMVMATDNQGNLLWHRDYSMDIPGFAIANSIISDGSGGYYLVGHAQRVSTSDKDVFALHISSCGDSVGTKWIGNTVDEEAARAVMTSSGQIVSSGVAVLPGNQREILLYGMSEDSCNMPPCSFSRVAPQDSTMPDIGFPFVLNWSPSHDPEGAQIQYIFQMEHNYLEFGVSPTDTVVADTFVHLNIEVPLTSLDEIFDFHWRVWATDGLDTVEASNGEGFFQLDIIMDADDSALHPASFELSAYPNPFNPMATLSFSLTQPSSVSLDLFDTQGRLVQTLADNLMTAGSHNVTVNANDLASGIYFARLRAGSQTRMTKLVLMK